MLKRHIIIIFFLIVQLTYGQKNSNTINWEEDRLLVWEDFKGRANGASPYHAYTYGGITYNTALGGKNVKVIIGVYFDKKKSWLKKGKETDNLLIHEQGHFDIIELYSRIFLKRLDELEAMTPKKLSSVVPKIYGQVDKELTSFQLEYDKETKHSALEDKQQEWTEEIGAMLKEYKEYAGREVTIKLK